MEDVHRMELKKNSLLLTIKITK